MTRTGENLAALTRRVRLDARRRIARATPSADFPDAVVVPGAEMTTRNAAGEVVYSVMGADELIDRRRWAWEMTSHPLPLSGRIRKKIKRKR